MEINKDQAQRILKQYENSMGANEVLPRGSVPPVKGLYPCDWDLIHEVWDSLPELKVDASPLVINDNTVYNLNG